MHRKKSGRHQGAESESHWVIRYDDILLFSLLFASLYFLFFQNRMFGFFFNKEGRKSPLILYLNPKL